MLKKIILVFLAFFVVLSFSWSRENLEKPSKQEKIYEIKKVLIGTYSGVIIPVAVEYINSGIEKANKEKYDLFLLKLDTPGGLDASMREIVKKILGSKIPVLVYISPKGARAASAGVFITMAAHIAAMSPSTNIGAAHPVMIGGIDIDSLKDKKKKGGNPMEEKVLNDASAYIKSITQHSGRNVDWAIKAVTKSDSISSKEALEKKVVEFIAEDTDELLKKIDGFNLQSFGKIKISNPQLEYFHQTRRQNFLATITDPNIAMILMSIGAAGIFIELYNPGLILPGVVGGISMVLAFYAFQTLSANFAGLALIFLGFIFFIAEIKVMSYGLLSIGGVISIVLGTLMLFNNPSISGISVSGDILMSNLIGLIAIVAILSYIVVRSQMRKVVTGIEAIVGQKGITKTKLSPKGKVFVSGEIWEAESLSGDIDENCEIVIDKIEGFKVFVRKI